MSKKNRKKVKILLIALYHFEHLSTRLLQAILKQHGYECTILFFKGASFIKVKKTLKNLLEERMITNNPCTEDDYKKFKEFISSYNPDIIGFSVMSSFYSIAIEATRIARMSSNALILWGGIHATIAPEQCVDHADYVCIGEGVRSFPEFINAVANNKKFDKIKGFAYKKNKKVVINKEPELVTNLDELPFPDYSNEGKYYLDNGTIYENGQTIYFPGFIDTPYKSFHTISTSWGCPFKCRYCINSLIRQKIRRRTVDNVIAELKMIKDSNPHLKIINFYDDIFTMNHAWCEEFVEKYKREIDLPFWCYAHPKFSKFETLKILRDAGMVVVVTGIQTGNEKTRIIMGRSENDMDVIETAKNLDTIRNIPYKKFGRYLDIVYDLIIDNPFETRFELNNTLGLLCNLPKDFVLTQFSLMYFPGYPLTEDYLKRKLIKPEDIEGNKKKEKIDNFLDYNLNINEKDENKRMNNFYSILFFLAQYRLFPRWYLLKIGQSRFWYNNIGLLFKAARFFRFISLLLKVNIFIKGAGLISWKLVKIIPKLKMKEKDIPR